MSMQPYKPNNTVKAYVTTVTTALGWEGGVVLKSEFEREEHSMFPALNRISRDRELIGKTGGLVPVR